MARKGTMYDRTIDSTHLGESITVKIYEPEAYDTLYAHHVCIMQDGDDYFQIGRVATLSDRLHESEDIINTIFVGIPYIDRFDRWDKYHPDGKQFHAYQKFLVEELVPLLEDILPLNPLGKEYTLMGDSLGGTVSLITALACPGQFQKVVMQSPYVDDKVLDFVANFDDANEPEIWHTYGLLETSVGTTKMGKLDFVKPNEALVAKLKERISSYHLTINKEGNHTWKYWQKELPELLKEVFM